MRALVVTNMYPSTERPGLGSFVRDQVRALQQLPEVELELFAFAPGGAGAYARAARELRRRWRGRPLDVVHAHFGLTLWPALAAPGRVRAVTLHGTDLVHPRSRALSLAGLRLMDLPAVVSQPLAETVPAWAGRERLQVLPCGVDLERFRPIPREAARRELGLAPQEPCLLFPADPARPEKRFDRAREVAREFRLLTLGNLPPERVPLLVNAADAVLVSSERESFGLAVLEALACEVPVLSTPVGVAPEVLADLPGAVCAPYDRERWRAELRALLARPERRVAGGRERATPYSASAMAERVLEAWRAALQRA